MKSILIHITERQHERIHTLSEKLNRPVKHLLEGLLTESPILSEQEKKESLKALKLKKTDKNQETI